jgi:outer membrane protein OmpA-like peptidoglycan-associated protein
MAETIGGQTASYRQGLVLGLTMAEIMLLLVFCVLIAVGVVLAGERMKLDGATARLSEVEAAAAADRATAEAVRRNPRLTELLDRASRSASPAEIDEFWRKLVDNADLVTGMERQGISVAALRRDEHLASLQRLLNDRVDPDAVARALALTAAIDASFAARSMPAPTPQQAAVLLDKGIASFDRAGEAEERKAHTWPPIINLSEAGGYYFATGSAELTPEFAVALQTVVVARLLEIAGSFDVDVIEVIGHTDEQPVSNRPSNLDRSLAGVTLGNSETASLQWGDNAGLGLARALAVVKVLSSDYRLTAFRILPFSGAQLIGTDGRLTRWDGKGDVRERRRIEIRMRKSTDRP